MNKTLKNRTAHTSRLSRPVKVLRLPTALKLSTTTIRSLQNESLAQVAGGRALSMGEWCSDRRLKRSIRAL
jgi:hypothetical protein